MKKVVFKAGEYIVLLSGYNGIDSWKDEIPINYCYKLNRDSYNDNNGFGVEKDINGVVNGWGSGYSVNKIDYNIRFRIATFEEAREYVIQGKPYNINDFKPIKEDKKLYNKALIKLLKNLK